MNSIDETRLAAIRVIDNVITLKANVFNGCKSDQKELDIQEARLISIKKWAVENNQLISICHYLGSKNFGGHLQFKAAEVASFFNN